METRDPALGSRLINLLQLGEQTSDPIARAADARTGAAGGGKLHRRNARRRPSKALARTDELAAPLQARRLGVARFCRGAGRGLPASAPLKWRVSPIRLAIIRPIPSPVWRSSQPGPAGTNVLYGKGLVVKVKAVGPPAQGGLSHRVSAGPSRTGGHAADVRQRRRRVTTNCWTTSARELLVFAHTKRPRQRVQTGAHRRGADAAIGDRRSCGSPRRLTPASSRRKNPTTSRACRRWKAAKCGSGCNPTGPCARACSELTAGDQPPQRIALNKSGDNEVTGSFIAAESGRLRFGIVDDAGAAVAGRLRRRPHRHA